MNDVIVHSTGEKTSAPFIEDNIKMRYKRGTVVATKTKVKREKTVQPNLIVRFVSFDIFVCFPFVSDALLLSTLLLLATNGLT